MTEPAKYWLKKSPKRQKEIEKDIAQYISKLKLDEKDLISEVVKLKTEALIYKKLTEEFLAQISHEIRTPLNIITNYSELLSDELKIRGLYKEYEVLFKAIEKGSDRIIRTIELILIYAQLRNNHYSLHIKEFDIVSEVIVPLIERYNIKAIEKGLKLELDVSKCINGKVKMDFFSAEQILMNILDNAIKFTPNGEVRFVVYSRKNKLIVEIKDTGIGIDPEYLKCIYVPFVQEETGYCRSYDGNGLGLLVVKKFCDLNKVKLKIVSEKSVGTKVTMVFPSNERTN